MLHSWACQPSLQVWNRHGIAASSNDDGYRCAQPILPTASLRIEALTCRSVFPSPAGGRRCASLIKDARMRVALEVLTGRLALLRRPATLTRRAARAGLSRQRERRCFVLWRRGDATPLGFSAQPTERVPFSRWREKVRILDKGCADEGGA